MRRCSANLSQALDLASWEEEYHATEAQRAAERFRYHVGELLAARSMRRRLEDKIAAGVR